VPALVPASLGVPDPQGVGGLTRAPAGLWVLVPLVLGMPFYCCWGLMGMLGVQRAAVAVAGGLLLGIRLRFHHHAHQQLPSGLAFHQQAADEFGGDLLGGAGEEGWGEVLEGRGGCGSGLGNQGILRHQAPP